MKQNVYKQAMQIRVDTYTIWKREGSTFTYILHFNSGKSSECTSKYNIYTTFQRSCYLIGKENLQLEDRSVLHMKTTNSLRN